MCKLFWKGDFSFRRSIFIHVLKKDFKRGNKVLFNVWQQSLIFISTRSKKFLFSYLVSKEGY